MTTRFACIGLAVLSLVTWLAGTQARAAKTGDELIHELDLLFVQSADAGSFDGQRLTLTGVGTTLFFADRPARVSGHLDTAKFLGAWGAGAGTDSFAADPPNATLSILAADAPTNVVVELREPKHAGSTVSYAVKVLDGKLPEKFGSSSLFIDHHHGGDAGGYIAAGLGGAVLGGALVSASQPKEKVIVEQPAPPPVYYGPGYYYSAAPPPPPPPCRQ